MQLVRRGEPSPLSAFAGLLDNNEEASLSAFTFAPGDASHLAYRNPDVSRRSLAGLGEYPHSYSSLIADRCKQIGEIRRTRGLLSEPLWYACLGVLAFAEDGDQYAHEWSTGDERYTSQETNRKLAQERRLTGATTCARFKEVNPTGCLGCPWLGKIKSPIVLGYREDESEPQPEARQEEGHQNEIRSAEASKSDRSRSARWYTAQEESKRHTVCGVRFHKDSAPPVALRSPLRSKIRDRHGRSRWGCKNSSEIGRGNFNGAWSLPPRR